MNTDYLARFNAGFLLRAHHPRLIRHPHVFQDVSDLYSTGNLRRPHKRLFPRPQPHLQPRPVLRFHNHHCFVHDRLQFALHFPYMKNDKTQNTLYDRFNHQFLPRPMTREEAERYLKRKKRV